MMRKKTKFILACAFACAFLSTLLALSMPMLTSTYDIKEEVVLSDSIEVTPKVDPMDSIKNKLIEEAENYILSNFPKAKKTLPTALVESGLEHEIDIVFMMAQTQIETHFGTLGAGREVSRRSLFGVAVKRYDSYENAIQDYIALLKKSYLTKGRTEKHLMQRYTTTRGGRYAENPNYEVDLRGAYALISRNTNIDSLQKEYNRLNVEKKEEEKTL